MCTDENPPDGNPQNNGNPPDGNPSSSDYFISHATSVGNGEQGTGTQFSVMQWLVISNIMLPLQ